MTEQTKFCLCNKLCRVIDNAELVGIHGVTRHRRVKLSVVIDNVKSKMLFSPVFKWQFQEIFNTLLS